MLIKKPQNSPENFSKCVCPDCPVFTECNRSKGERLFCARIPTECAMNNSEICQCPIGCQVYSENKLGGAYFCMIEIKE